MKHLALLLLFPLSLLAPAQSPKVDIDALWKQATQGTDVLPLLTHVVDVEAVKYFDSWPSNRECQNRLPDCVLQLERFKADRSGTPASLLPEYDRQLAFLQLMTDFYRLRLRPPSAVNEQAVMDRFDPAVDWQKVVLDHHKKTREARPREKGQSSGRTASLSGQLLAALKDQQYQEALALASSTDGHHAKAALYTIMERGDKNLRRAATDQLVQKFSRSSAPAREIVAEREKKEEHVWLENLLMALAPGLLIAAFLFFMGGRTKPTAVRELQRVNRLRFEHGTDQAWIAAYQRLQNLPPDNAHRITAEALVCETLAERWSSVLGKAQGAASARKHMAELHSEFYEA